MNRIAELRKQKGLTQAELAEKIHTTQGTLSKWELETHDPDIENLFALADFFGVSIDYLTGYIDGNSHVSGRALKEYLTGRFKIQFRDSEVSVIDSLLAGVVKLMQERLSK